MKPSPWHELSSAERARIEDEQQRARYRAEMSKRILLIFAFVGVILAMLLMASSCSPFDSMGHNRQWTYYVHPVARLTPAESYAIDILQLTDDGTPAPPPKLQP